MKQHAVQVIDRSNTENAIKKSMVIPFSKWCLVEVVFKSDRVEFELLISKKFEHGFAQQRAQNGFVRNPRAWARVKISRVNLMCARMGAAIPPRIAIKLLSATEILASYSLRQRRACDVFKKPLNY